MIDLKIRKSFKVWGLIVAGVDVIKNVRGNRSGPGLFHSAEQSVNRWVIEDYNSCPDESEYCMAPIVMNDRETELLKLC